MNFLTKIRKKIKREKAMILPDKDPPHIDKTKDVSTNTTSDPFAGQYGFLEAILGQQAGIPGSFGSLLSGMTQEQQYQRYQAMAQQQAPEISLLKQAMFMGAIPAVGMCQPSRPPVYSSEVRRKHVDCHIVEPKGLPENIESPRGD